MAADHLVRNGLCDLSKAEPAALIRHLRVIDHLEQQIAQFIQEQVWVIRGDGVRDLIAFLNCVRRDGGEILHQIPGAAAIWVAQLGHDGEQGVERGFRRILLRGLGHLYPA